MSETALDSAVSHTPEGLWGSDGEPRGQLHESGWTREDQGPTAATEPSWDSPQLVRQLCTGTGQRASPRPPCLARALRPELSRKTVIPSRSSKASSTPGLPVAWLPALSLTDSWEVLETGLWRGTCRRGRGGAGHGTEKEGDRGPVWTWRLRRQHPQTPAMGMWGSPVLL